MKLKVNDIAEGRITPEQAEALQHYFQGGGTWADLLQLKPEEVEEVYAKGYTFYNEGFYEEALASFGALIQLNPYKADHWIAIGATLQAKKEYTDALAAYEFALSLEAGNGAALYYSAQCNYLLDQKEEALTLLKKIEEPSFSSQAQLFCELLKQEGIVG